MKPETLFKQTVMRLLPTKLWVQIDYRFHMGKKCDLVTPQTFNEKLCWMKVYYPDSRQVLLIDKDTVRGYVADQIGSEHLITQYGVWERFDDIDFDILPKNFVLKPTHTSGDIYFCEDKSQLDRKALRKTVNRWMRRNFYHQSREWGYKCIKPRIVAQELLLEEDGGTLRDYKFMCFNGEPKCFQITQNHRNGIGTTVNYYDMQWNPLPVRKKYSVGQGLAHPPIGFNQMVILCKTLAKPFPFVRMDFYISCGHIYFGEFTFCPGSGIERYYPDDWDLIFGNWLELPQKFQRSIEKRCV